MIIHQYDIEVTVKADHLHVRAAGVRTRETIVAITADVFDAIRVHDRGMVLIDVTNLDGRLGVVDSYFVATEVFQGFRGKGLRRAAVLTNRARPSRGWFLETVSRNRGFNFAVFSDQLEALAWLRSGASDSG